ncbi:HlyC/CorC family transporter [Faecalibacterium prausnitzii]|jgi:CBS domain containing-hemolysin-like protein|uniref:Transporter n=1 Tax=Faecalibacterium prausnitzii TaxID=853 RepID=A0A2A7ANZ6_9FIRM|nr:hemolysin family protein [Faecalibacterium prausnitzii]PDX80783.1 transporter [Faecalibacterium prausnitzii]
MDDGSMTLWVTLVILVAFSAFFSASETAFSSLNQIRLKSRADDGDRTAARVLAMSEQYDKLLSTILIGNNIVNIAAASIGTIIFTKMLGAERGATVSTMVLTIVVLIFGEVTPKSLAKEMPETIATAVAPALSLLMLVFTPLTWLFSQWKRLLNHFVHSSESDTITEGELMTMVSEAENDGELTDRESELIRSAIEFDDVEVEEILTPRVDVVAVADDISLEELAQTFAESGYSRLPVYHGTIDNIIGVVHEKDFYIARLKKATKIDDLVAPTLYTTGSTQISQLLRTLREQHHHMAVVVDEYGGTEGIITLEDILEELVGEIWDEHDEVTEDFRKQSDGSWLVSGSASVDDLFETLDLPEDEDIDSNTVNGLVQEKTCHLPKVGDHFSLGEYDGVVTRTARRRVTEVRLTPTDPAAAPDSPDEKEKRFPRLSQNR